MDVVIYTRFSPGRKQNEHSTIGQIKVCREYAERNNLNIIDIYTDEAKSGTKDDRANFQRMIKDSEQKKFQGVLVYQLDRFARDKYDSVVYKRKLKKNGVRVLSARENISDDASGILMESVLEGMAEYYSVELGQKVKRGMETNAESCYYNGGTIPLGLKVKSIYVPLGPKGKLIEKKQFDIDEEKAPIIQKIFEMYINDYTMADIIRYLNKKNIKTSYGKEFNKNSIRTIILNKKYIGIYEYQGKETPNAIPRIIDDDTFYQAREKLLKNKEAPARARANADYLLTTKLFCGTCKEMMVGVSGRSGNNTQYCYYSCKNTLKHKCNRKNIKKDYIEDLVVDLARGELTDDNINEMANAVYKTACKTQDHSRIKQLQREILENESQKTNLVNSLKMCNDDNVRKYIFEEMSKMEQQKIELQNQIEEEESSMFLVSEKEIKYFLKSLQNGNKNDLKYRQMIINVLIYKVYIYDDNITIIYNANGKPVETRIPNIKELESSIQAQKSHHCSNMGNDAQPKKHQLRCFFMFVFYINQLF